MRSLFQRRKTAQQEGLDALLQLAQNGDDNARNDLIRQYTPFVLKAASQAAKRYIHRDSDDEYSIALIALNEAIDKFDASRNASFLSFAGTIIQRRIIDYFRSQEAHGKVLPWTDFEVEDEEDNVVNYVEIRASLETHEAKELEERRRMEIMEYTRQLAEFGLTFSDLVEASPKHADARQSAIAVARLISEDEDLKRHVFEKQSLPLKQVEDRVAVSRKTLERQRRYILAIILLLSGDFECLQSYLAG